VTAAELEDTETERIIRWRLHELQRAGYDWQTALLIAVRTDVDLHFAAELVGMGCPTKTAARILL
jgi:hypothetical protein